MSNHTKTRGGLFSCLIRCSKKRSTSSIMRIRSKLDLKTIEYSDFEPIYPYQCPICYKYFSAILKFSCCKNYICHFCAKNMNNSVKESKKMEICCPFCRKDKGLILEDVGAKERVRNYFDSPKATPVKEKKIVSNISPSTKSTKDHEKKYGSQMSINEPQTEKPGHRLNFQEDKQELPNMISTPVKRASDLDIPFEGTADITSKIRMRH